MRECPSCGRELSADATFCSNCGTDLTADAAGGKGVVVGTPDAAADEEEDDSSGGRTVVMQIDPAMFDDVAPVDVVDPRKVEPPAPAAAPPRPTAAPAAGAAAPPQDPARRPSARTMIGIPLAEQAARQAQPGPARPQAPPPAGQRPPQAQTPRPQPPAQATRPPQAAPAGQRPAAQQPPAPHGQAPQPQRPSTKTMVGIPLAEQLARQETGRAGTTPPQPAAPRPAGAQAAPPAGAPGQPRPGGEPERRPSSRTMIGIPLAEQLARPSPAGAAPQPTRPAAVTAPQPTPTPAKAAGSLDPGLAQEDDRTSMMPAFSEAALHEPEPEPAPRQDLAEPAPAGEEYEPTRAVAPLPAEPEPEPTVAAWPEPEPEPAAPAVSAPGPSAAVAPTEASERPLPALPNWPCEPEALQPPPAPGGLFGALGYAFKTIGLGGRIKKCLVTAERRRELLIGSRDETLVAIGQQAWNEGIRTESLASHRAAIEQAQSASAELEEQLAALDRAFAAEEEQVRADVEARTQKAEGLERQHTERDREYQGVARETNDTTKVLKDTEKQIAGLEKTLEKLNATPQDKRAPDHAQKVGEAERELGTLREQAPGVKARVDELTVERDRQKEEVTALRNEIKKERAEIAEVEKALAARAKEIEGQKASLRGELAGAEAGMRGPLLTAGKELYDRRRSAPSLEPLFRSVDAHDAAVGEEAQREERYRGAERAYQPAVAKKGWLIIGGAVLALIAVIVILALLLGGGGGGGGGLAAGPRNALPKDLGGVMTVDVDNLLGTPLAKRLGDKVGPQLGKSLGQAGEALNAIGAKPSDVHSVTLGLRFPPDGGEPLMLGVIDATVDAAKVKEVFAKEGFEERKMDGGATKLVKRDKTLVLKDGLFLVAEGDGSALLDESPLLAGSDKASVGDNEALMAITRDVDTDATAWGVFVVPPGLDRELRDAPVKLVPGDRVGVSVDLDSGIRLVGHFVLTEASRAEQLEQFLKAGIEQAKGQVGEAANQFPPAAALIDDLKGIIDDVEISRSDTSVHIEAHVPQGLIDRALDLFEPMMGMFLQGGLD